MLSKTLRPLSSLVGAAQSTVTTSIVDSEVLINFEPTLLSLTWTTKIALLVILSIVLLGKTIAPPPWTKPQRPIRRYRTPVLVPYKLPLIGHLYDILRHPKQLAIMISQTLKNGGIARLNVLGKDIYVVSGAEYVTAILKNSKGMSNSDVLSIALSHMFGTPSKDMEFFARDRSGVTHDPHPQSKTKPEHRVFHLMFKAAADWLSGPYLAAINHKFEASLRRRLDALPVQNEWVQKDDLLIFIREHFAHATVEAILGPTFMRRYPEFVENFYLYNSQILNFLRGVPGCFIPKASKARERCKAMLQDWRATHDKDNYDGSPFIIRRWEYFSRMQGPDGISDYAVACQDLGILWGMLSNSLGVTFWTFWHTMRDRSLMREVLSEIDACTKISDNGKASLDQNQILSQPLLQSLRAESLRKYIALYVAHMTEYEESKVLDFQVPQNKLIVLSTDVAHREERNWKVDEEQDHAVDKFWAQRFLVPDSNRTNGPNSTQFSTNRYKGAFIPFGGGVHQCPGRHWTKGQLMLSLGVILSKFEMELTNDSDSLKVDMGKFGMGALMPREKAPFRIRKR